MRSIRRQPRIRARPIRSSRSPRRAISAALRQGASRAVRRISADAAAADAARPFAARARRYRFLPGPGPRTIDAARLRQCRRPVCYEIVFSGQVVDRAAPPGAVFNPSNDAWFGTLGPAAASGAGAAARDRGGAADRPRDADRHLGGDRRRRPPARTVPHERQARSKCRCLTRSADPVLRVGNWMALRQPPRCCCSAVANRRWRR